tara:strand:- start:2298 stop:3563 length:1266 start_codon:yes stop_codon:yes gene_type:complete
MNKIISNQLIFFVLILIIISKWHLIFQSEEFQLSYFELRSFVNYSISLIILFLLMINIQKITINSTVGLYLFGTTLFLILNFIFASPSNSHTFYWIFYSTLVPTFSILVYVNFRDQLNKALNFLFITHLAYSIFVILTILYFAGPFGSNILPVALITQEGYNNILHANTLTNDLLNVLWFSKGYIGWVFLFVSLYYFYIKKSYKTAFFFILFLLFNRTIMVGIIFTLIIFFIYSKYRLLNKYIFLSTLFILILLITFTFFDEIFYIVTSDTRWTLYSLLPYLIYDYPFGIGIGTFSLNETNEMLINKYTNYLFLDNYLSRYLVISKTGWYIPPAPESNIVLFLSDQGIFYLIFLIFIVVKIFNYILLNWNYIDDISKLICTYFMILFIGGIGEDLAYEWIFWLFFGLSLGVYVFYNYKKLD